MAKRVLTAPETHSPDPFPVGAVLVYAGGPMLGIVIGVLVITILVIVILRLT